MSVGELFFIACGADCIKCFGVLDNQCTECDPQATNKYLEAFTCVAACSIGTLDTEDNICKSNKYDTDFICPKGSYNPDKIGTTSGSCIDCDGGKYCKGTGLTATSGDWLEGYYCTTKAWYAANDDHLSTILSVVTGGRCDAGNFCIAGSSSQTTCTAGKYCSEDYLSAVSGDCTQRYYCLGGTNIARPTNTATMFGDICTAGSFCDTGVSGPTQCPAGTYQPNEGAATNAECLSCPPGEYCQTAGLSATNGACTVGFFCEGGNSSPAPATAICAVGYYCPSGSVQQIECDEDSYQSSSTQGTCPLCPANNYCFETNSPQTCEAGYYCPGSNKKKPCPPGEFGDVAAQDSQAAGCSACPVTKACETFGLNTNYKTCKAGYFCLAGAISQIPSTTIPSSGGRCAQGEICAEGSGTAVTCTQGKYWDRVGLSEPTGNCEAGYYCQAGGNRQNPRGTLGDICPAGHYCPEGSSTYAECPIGTYRSAQGGESLSDCDACPDGFYCETAALTDPSLTTCTAGFYCPEGQEVGAPVAYQCPTGSYCPAGAKIALKWEIGTYQSQLGQTTWDPCPQGNYCDGTDSSTYIACVVGYICPAGTKYSTETPCPEGTYNNLGGRWLNSECLSCPAGYFCDQKGQSTFSKKLLEGYYSTATGEIDPTPADVTDVKGRCETGNYCPEGSSSLTPCPVGTYNDARVGTSSDDCLNCPPGEFCNTAGETYAQLVALASTSHGTCTQGYVCYPGSTTATPNDNIMGIICPIGHYCPAGTFKEIVCATGSFAPNTG
jgi:hypothetical protein